jgi:hypothetical protein
MLVRLKAWVIEDREAFDSNRTSPKKLRGPGSFATELGIQHHVRCPPDSDLTADIAGGPLRAHKETNAPEHGGLSGNAGL